MICPVCSSQMVERDFGGVHVDVCADGCKGMWFDWGELNHLDEQNEGLGEALEEALNHPRRNDAARGKIKCPKCGIAMQTHGFKMATEVNVDECYSCGGYFLDSGELTAARSNRMSDEEHQEYLDGLLTGVSGYEETKKSVEGKKKQTEVRKKRREAARRFSRYMRFGFFR